MTVNSSSPSPSPKIDPDRTIPDLRDGVGQRRHRQGGHRRRRNRARGGLRGARRRARERQPRVGEIYPDEIEDDGYDSAEAENAVEGPDGAAAAAAVTARPERDRAARRRERGGGNRVGTFLRNSWEELKRVQWPDRRQVAQATAVVAIFVIIIGAYLGLADWVFGKLVDAIL